MPSFLRHPAVKYIGGGIIGLFILAIVIAMVFGSLNASRSTGFSADYISSPQGLFKESAVTNRAITPEIAGDYGAPVYPITPNSGYVPNLEDFETTNYNLSGRLKDFNTACNALTTLKANDRFHFKSLSTNLNSCYATFYTEEAFAGEAIANLQFNGVTVSRNTQSVTRHRENIASQASIIRQQLVSVENTLAEAELAYDEIAVFAREERDVSEYSQAIDAKLRQIDQLTNRKISLTSQLDSIAQQAADLEERIGVVEISVNYSRSFTLNPDKTSRAWEQAWETLSDTWTNFGIGLTAYFGVFLLYALQYGLYLLVLILLARFGWKVVRMIWKL